MKMPVFEYNNLENFDFSSVPTPEYAPREQLKDGVYNTSIKSITIGSKSDERTFVVTHEILDGEAKGRTFRNYFNIYKSRMGAEVFKTMLKVLGLSEEEIVELGSNIKTLLNAIVGLNVRTKVVIKEDFPKVVGYNKAIGEYENKPDVISRYKDSLNLVEDVTEKYQKGIW